MSAARPKTKVVIRNLPPGMTDDTFKTVLESLAGGRYTWLSYFPGKVSLKRVVFSRAYVNFLTAEDVYDFKQRFDGHVFIGQKGHQYRCSVEYAPLQKVPAQEEKPHPLDDTIEKDTDYLVFLEAYEAGLGPPSTAVPGAAAAASDLPSATASGGAADGEGKVVMSRLMEYLVQKYAEGGNRLGGMRAATKAKQSKQDLIQQVNVSAQQEGRGTSAAGAAKSAKAAAAAAIAAAKASDTPSAKGPRRERDRSTKGAQLSLSTEGPSSKAAEKQPGASRGAGGKGARHGSAEAATETAAPTITLLTRASAAQGAPSKGHGKEPSAEKILASGSSSGGGRNDARAAHQAGAAETDGGSAGAAQSHEPRKTRGGRTAGTQQGAARGFGPAGQEEAPPAVRPASAATPRLLLVKGGEARLTQGAPGSGSAGQSAAAATVATNSAAAKKQAQEPQQALRQSQAPRSSGKQPAASAQEHSSANGGANAQAVKAVPPSAGAPTTGERSSGKASAGPSASGAVTGSKPGAAASSAAAATPPAGSTPALPDGSSPEDGLAATASAAAAAALAAAATGPSGKKVRPGFQMYVPGSLRGRPPGNGAATGGSSTNG